TLMLSRPDDWIFHEDALVDESTEGRDALRSAMKELVVSGWMTKAQPRSGGRFNGNVYQLNSTVDWKPVDGSAVDAKSTPTNTESTKTEEPTPQPPKGGESAFDEFWKIYPTKIAKPKCLDIWKRKKLDAKLEAILAGVKRWARSDRWQR